MVGWGGDGGRGGGLLVWVQDGVQIVKTMDA